MVTEKTSRPSSDTQQADRAERLELYKTMVEMADRISQRRQAANSFYLSINTLLIGGSALTGTFATSLKQAVLISVVGLLVCKYWNRSILSYKTLNTAKFGVINDIETRLIEQPFTKEWSALDPDGDGKKHNSFYETEKLVPRLFVGLYLFQIALAVPWRPIWEKVYQGVC